ncbi:MAG: undecaprenyl-phosphate galactose phosphotransferase WbaP [Deltaproteobacteria bacterium]|nr:undecaprenyl-phosphate galactose phosphotransferase WbaP [Deltaproteobacteria bacterium]
MGKDAFKVTFVTLILVLLDLSALFLSFACGYYLRSSLFSKVIHLFPPILHGVDIYLDAWPILFLWPLAFAYEGIYPSIGMSFWEETKSLLKGNVLAFTILIVLTFVTKTAIQFSRPVIILSFIASLMLLPLARRLCRSLSRKIGFWSRDVALVGRADALRQLVCNLNKHPDWGLTPVGAVLVDSTDKDIGLPMFGKLDDIDEIRLNASEVIVAVPGASSRELVDIVEKAAKIAPVVKVLPDLYGLASAGVQTHDLDGMLLLEIEDRLARTRNRAIKRIFDIVLSLLGLVVLSPLFLILAILIKLSSRGPVFFGHTRVGKDGNTFTCYKFRTMVENAKETLEELLANDPEARAQWDKDFKLKEDPRVTRVGSFLRRTSLDELPQLWNALKGEMSLVGPRPIVSDEVEKYGEKARYFFKVTPGITGLWQVSGRNDIDYDERVLLDEYYAKNWSLWLDIEIIIRTFGAVLKKQGAY